jgi:hypothetical protein
MREEVMHLGFVLLHIPAVPAGVQYQADVRLSRWLLCRALAG